MAGGRQRRPRESTIGRRVEPDWPLARRVQKRVGKRIRDLDLGPHAVFIWVSYAVVALAIGGLIAWLVIDGQRHERQLTELDAQGVRRRSREGTEGEQQV